MVNVAWIKQIRKGDVVESKTKSLRIVRAVQHSGPSLGKTSVTFAIQHCSWTGRCYTVYTGSDLRTMGYRPVRARFRLRTDFDVAIEREFGRPPGQKRTLGCCDVLGVA